MIDFKTIRAAVPTIQAAKDYGLDVGRHGMARCPFHDDHSPSLKLDDRFYCFGCGASVMSSTLPQDTLESVFKAQRKSCAGITD